MPHHWDQPTDRVGASDTVSSHGDYNSLIDDMCEPLPDSSLGQASTSSLPSTSHGQYSCMHATVWFMEWFAEELLF